MASLSEATGRSQAAASTKGKRHSNFQTLYSGKRSSVDLYRQNFRFVARTADGTFDVSSIVEQVSWEEQTADTFGSQSPTPMTGELQLRKPQLPQYNKLLPPFLSASVDAKNRVSRLGALGVVFIAEVGYGGQFTPVWAMRCVPGDSTSAEQVELADGTWTLQLADDLWTINQSTQDWKFTKSGQQHRLGWRAHEVAAAVCAEYSIPVKQLAKGTAWFELGIQETTSVSPSTVIWLAYQQETQRTGRNFVTRWSAPDKKFPFGALEVVPMRRNKNLLVFRKQLIDAVLQRSQSGDFATVLEARGYVKAANGKHRKVTFIAHSQQAVRRFGWVRKIVDFQSVGSELELQILAKRALAQRLLPIRGAELTHPGIATIRRGDAIRIDLPEEGYAPVSLSAEATPTGTPYTAKQLLAAEQNDPSMFGLPDPSLLTATGSASLSKSTSNALNTNLGAVLPVADQGIAFVTSITHTLVQGSYTVDLQTGFMDMLDPREVQEQIDLALRKVKATGQTDSSSSTGGASGSGWVTTGATEFNDPPPGAGNLTGAGYHFAELGTATSRGVGTGVGNLAMAFGMSGELPMGYKVDIQYNGKLITADKQDRGYGQGGDGTHSDQGYSIDLWDGSGSGHENAPGALGFSGKAQVQARPHQ